MIAAIITPHFKDFFRIESPNTYAIPLKRTLGLRRLKRYGIRSRPL